MSLEDSYDAWVRGLMGGGKYAATPRQTAEASEAVQQMQAQLDALTAARSALTAAQQQLEVSQALVDDTRVALVSATGSTRRPPWWTSSTPTAKSPRGQAS